MAELKPDQAAQGLSLSRWSRLKRAAATDQLPNAPVRPERSEGLDDAMGLATDVVDSESARARLGDEATGQSSASLETHALPSLSSISLSEDFTPFMQAKVPQALKQQALKALFREPHFNVMDGLDIYIDDYTVFEPITPEVMATLSSWKSIMNPPQQIVTPQGYAVDVESDEGKAVLAARAEVVEAISTPPAGTGDVQVPSPAARSDMHVAPDSGAEGEGGDMPQPTLQTSDPESTDEPLQVYEGALATALTPTPETTAASPSPRAAGEGAKPHIRYGKRVGDFSPVLVNESAADSTNASTVQATDTLSGETQKNSS